jgi:hypothetical protein
VEGQIHSFNIAPDFFGGVKITAWRYEMGRGWTYRHGPAVDVSQAHAAIDAWLRQARWTIDKRRIGEPPPWG